MADRQIFGELGVSAKVEGGSQLSCPFPGHLPSELRPSRCTPAQAGGSRMSSTVKDHGLRRLELVVGNYTRSPGINNCVPPMGRPAIHIEPRVRGQLRIQEQP
jgi:hypothetical protein